MVKGEAKLYPAVFVGWVILPGSNVTRDIWVLPWNKLQRALETQSFRGRSSLSRSREYFRPVQPEYLVLDWLQVTGVHIQKIQEIDEFEGELEGETEAENDVVNEIPESNKLEMQPPATEREITQKEKRDERVAEWHVKVLSKPGVERVDWPDGFP
eukprot:5611154-Amphidinium_carterae.1